MSHATSYTRSTIKTAGGHYFDLASPRPEDVDIRSIAAALGKTCRFGGHCPKFYSVAEHSVWAQHIADLNGEDVFAQRAILMHDAAEAYIGDIVTPLKAMLPGINAIELQIERAISEAFGVDFEPHRDVIKKYDRMMLKAEKQAMWPEDSEHWDGFEDIEDPAITVVEFWPPRLAETAFFVAAKTLGVAGASL